MWDRDPADETCHSRYGQAMSQDVIDRISKLIGDFDRRVQAAPPDSWDNDSPCEGWTARDVVAHVGGNMTRLVAGLTGGEPRPIGADDDIVAAWNEARDAFLGCLPTADLATAIPAGPMGEMPAAQLIGRMLANDVLVHTWDLARAVGGDERLDPETVAMAYSGMKPMDEMIRRPGIFGPKIEVESGDVQTEFLAFLGRKV